MLNNLLAEFYERDLLKLMEEVNLFADEANLWKTVGSVKNSSGNLALHIIGGSNYLIGAQLGHTGYIRNRDLEFSRKDVERNVLIARLEELIPIVTNVVRAVSLETEYPIPFDGGQRTNAYVLWKLLSHLNYHTGQVNYLRRSLE